MKVNLNKTVMVTISDALSFRPVAYIEGEDGDLIVGDKSAVKIWAKAER